MFKVILYSLVIVDIIIVHNAKFLYHSSQRNISYSLLMKMLTHLGNHESINPHLTFTPHHNQTPHHFCYHTKLTLIQNKKIRSNQMMSSMSICLITAPFLLHHTVHNI